MNRSRGKLLAASFFAAAVPSGVAMAGIPKDVTFFGSFDSHDYYQTDNLVDIFEARAIADSFGDLAYVVAINSMAEQDFLNLNLGFDEEFWIGLSDELVEGVFLWDSGEPFIFEFWAPGEPNNHPPQENYVVMNFGLSDIGQWNDTDPDEPLRRAIIEVPAPGALAVLGLAGVIGPRRRRL